MVAAVEEMVRFGLLFAHMRTKLGRSVPAQTRFCVGWYLVDTKSGSNDSLQEKAAKKSCLSDVQVLGYAGLVKLG